MNLLITVEFVFGAVLIAGAVGALRHSWRFARFGWQTIDAVVTSRDDWRTHVESRRLIADGGRFLVVGTLGMLAGVVAGAFGAAMISFAVAGLAAG